MSAPVPQLAAIWTVMQASTSAGLLKEYWSNLRVPVAVESGPGQAFGPSQPLGAPSRPSRELWSASVAERSPDLVCAGPPPQVGSASPNVPVAPLESVTVSVNAIGVPQTNADDVASRNGTVLAPDASIARLG